MMVNVFYFRYFFVHVVEGQFNKLLWILWTVTLGDIDFLHITHLFQL